MVGGLERRRRKEKVNTPGESEVDAMRRKGAAGRTGVPKDSVANERPHRLMVTRKVGPSLFSGERDKKKNITSRWRRCWGLEGFASSRLRQYWKPPPQR